MYPVSSTFRVVGNHYGNSRYEGRVARIEHVDYPTNTYAIRFLDNGEYVTEWTNTGDMELLERGSMYHHNGIIYHGGMDLAGTMADTVNYAYSSFQAGTAPKKKEPTKDELKREKQDRNIKKLAAYRKRKGAVVS